MLIDWFTVVAQAINFVILVALMRRFLYRPILDAIDAREQRVTAELAAAQLAQQTAREAQIALDTERETMARQQRALWEDVRRDAASERERLLTDARNEAAGERETQRAALHRALVEQRAVLARHAQAQVFDLARKVVGDLAGATLESLLVTRFIERLAELPEADRERLANISPADADAGVTVHSAFPLTGEQEEALRLALGHLVGDTIPVSTAVNPALLGGLEITVGGHRVSWSASDYLQQIERATEQLATAVA